MYNRHHPYTHTHAHTHTLAKTRGITQNPRLLRSARLPNWTYASSTQTSYFIYSGLPYLWDCRLPPPTAGLKQLLQQQQQQNLIHPNRLKHGNQDRIVNTVVTLIHSSSKKKNTNCHQTLPLTARESNPAVIIKNGCQSLCTLLLDDIFKAHVFI